MNGRFWLIVVLTILATVLIVTRLILPRFNQTSSISSVDPRFSEIEIIVKDIPVPVALADTSAEIVQGLSGTPSMPQNAGMLFDLGKREVPSFWMKEMLFSLDMIWIDETQIVDITKYVPVPVNPTNLPTYSPRTPATHVLEMNAGWADRNNIQIGDRVSIPN